MNVKEKESKILRAYYDMKEKLLISFSGGETSAYMTQWCLNYWKDVYDMYVVFANTGEENEETLEFVKKCDEILDFNTVWVESVVHEGRTGTTHKIVDFETASRNGKPFEEVISKYGIPNQAYPHCTRELKTAPITSFIKNEVGWNDYYTAIGIRVDEVDRVDSKREEKKFLYPLAEHHRCTKQHINKFWSEMPFRLELKGYQGNCKACWKKSFRKLYTIANETPEAFDNMQKWEKEYGHYVKPERSDKSKPPFRFYRDNTTVKEIIETANKLEFRPASDDSLDTTIQTDMFDPDLDVGFGCSESCEPF